MSITVTATQGGGGADIGMLLRVKVLTGAQLAAAQTGATAHAEDGGSDEVTFSTTTTGSIVYGATSGANAITPASGCTFFDQYDDTNHAQEYGTFRTTSATGTPGSVTVGDSSAGNSFDDVAAAEILAGGTISEDASSPAMVYANLTTVTTASFDPPQGALLVAMIGSNGQGDGSALTTMSVSDSSGLTWTPLAEAASTTSCYAGVWIAQVPGVAFVAASNNPSTSSGTWSHTNSNAGNAIVVATCSGTGATNDVTGITYGGVALDFLGYVQANNDVAGGIVFYGLIGGLPTGSNSVVVGGYSEWAGAATYGNVGSFGTLASSFGDSYSELSFNVTGTTTGGIVVVGICGGSGDGSAPLATSPATLRWYDLADNGSAAGNGWFLDEPSVGGGSTTTIASTYPSVDDWWGALAVELIPPSGGGGGGSPAASLLMGSFI